MQIETVEWLYGLQLVSARSRDISPPLLHILSCFSSNWVALWGQTRAAVTILIVDDCPSLKPWFNSSQVEFESLKCVTDVLLGPENVFMLLAFVTWPRALLYAVTSCCRANPCNSQLDGTTFIPSPGCEKHTCWCDHRLSLVSLGPDLQRCVIMGAHLPAVRFCVWSPKRNCYK